MSHIKKLEEVLELLINEEEEQAADIFHQIVLEKAREIYAELVEDFGSDVDTDYADEIEQDKNEIEADELFNDAEAAGDEGAEEAGEEGETEGEQAEEDERIADLEAQIEELTAKFEELLGNGEEEAGDEFGMEDDEFKAESLEEATKLSDEVSVDMSKEGKLAGAGGTATVATKSPIAKNGSPVIPSAAAVKIGKASGEGDNKVGAADKKGSSEANSTKTANTNVDMSKEGKGVAAGSTVGKTATKSVVSK